jgi:hypothetical protein
MEFWGAAIDVAFFSEKKLRFDQEKIGFTAGFTSKEKGCEQKDDFHC